MGRRVLITGAGGFVGANLARRLLLLGDDVVAAVRPGGDVWRLADVREDIRTEPVDLADESAARQLVAAVRPDWLFHLAVFGAYSWQTERSRILTTALGATAAILDAAAEHGFDAFVHAGSSSEYGPKRHAPREDEPLDPTSTYGVAKAAATLYCRSTGRRVGLRVRTLRLYSVYGPWEDPRRLFPQLIAHGTRGSFPPLVSRHAAHDFVHVDDVVDAFIAAASIPGGDPQGVYNVGSGTQRTLADVVEVARRELAIDSEPAWGSLEDRAWDTDLWLADISRARGELGWSPQTPLAEGFARMVAWLDTVPAAVRSRYVQAA